jgi:glycosyltransferase involved in cell wall biosynthesis
MTSKRTRPTLASTADPLNGKIENLTVALMLPCLNEEMTLGKVIQDFKAALPQIEVYVFDNNSTDRSAEIAREEGATLVRVSKRGKGYVVRKMFEVVDADIYVMVDSDDTYDAKALRRLMEPIVNEEADMVVASRLSDHSVAAFRRFHRLGNSLIQGLVNVFFRSQLTDICSGYRVLSRQFVKNIPFLRDGFEVETELTVYSLIHGFTIREIPATYKDRPPNSFSKLHTFRDGYKVLLTIVWLARDTRPLLFFTGCAFLLFFGVTIPSLHYLPTSAFTHSALSLLSISMLMTGLILNTLNVKFSELQLLHRRDTATRLTVKSTSGRRRKAA